MECVDAEAEADILQIDVFLEQAEGYLAEALQTLAFPELYGLGDPERQDKALAKLRKEVEAVQEMVTRARNEIFL